MQSSAEESLWQLIDGVLVVNLDHRTDRWEQFQQNAQGLIPPEKLHRLSACFGRELPGFGQSPWFRGGKRDGTWAGRAGCLLSHRSALLKARENGWRVTLVFEDDISFEPDFSSVAAALATALRECDWEVCYLGCTEPWSPGRRLARLNDSFSLHQIQGATTTHAYLVREAARDWILSQLPDETRVWSWVAAHRAIDRWYQRQLGLHFPVACVSPSLVKQISGYSDVVEKDADHSANTNIPAALSVNGSVAYHFGRAGRRACTWLGYAADILHGLIRRLTGF